MSEHPVVGVILEHRKLSKLLAALEGAVFSVVRAHGGRHSGGSVRGAGQGESPR